MASLALLGTLAACGGGGGTTDPADRAASYEGEWQTGCYPLSIVKDVVTQENTNVKRAVTLTRVDNTNLTFAYAYTVFASDDTQCAGTPLGKIESTGLNSAGATTGTSGVRASNGINSVKFEGTATVDGKTVDQFSEIRPALASIFGSNATVTAGTGNRFTFNTADFQAKNSKNIANLVATQFTLGEPNATAFPTALGTTTAYIYSKVTSGPSAATGAPN